jgi:hypothetical protein
METLKLNICQRYLFMRFCCGAKRCGVYFLLAVKMQNMLSRELQSKLALNWIRWF